MIACFESGEVHGRSVAELEVLVRTTVFKSANAVLGLEVGYPPALAKLICLEGANEPTYLKAGRHLEQTGGITVSARQIQRVVQRVGGSALEW